MMDPMNTPEILDRIKKTESPLKRQLLLVALITKLLEEKGKPAPVVSGAALCPITRGGVFHGGCGPRLRG